MTNPDSASLLGSGELEKVTQDLGISRRMLRLARFLERLPIGKRYVVTIDLPQSPTERMMWEVSEVNVVRESDS
jgi:hypothetical protein